MAVLKDKTICNKLLISMTLYVAENISQKFKSTDNSPSSSTSAVVAWLIPPKKWGERKVLNT
jgi:hypothetical protein